uniref:Bm1911, isoform b n=1 Tax=Brugia malayi TaxID=6279 RepID=A0A1I9G4A7_BRUMA|nr:Bm1911, isoform b [Brugia malayi]
MKFFFFFEIRDKHQLSCHRASPPAYAGISLVDVPLEK